jgi:hypothetical protein
MENINEKNRKKNQEVVDLIIESWPNKFLSGTSSTFLRKCEIFSEYPPGVGILRAIRQFFNAGFDNIITNWSLRN